MQRTAKKVDHCHLSTNSPGCMLCILVSNGFPFYTESHADTMTVTTSALSLLLALAVGYIVYLKRDDLPCWSRGNSSARESESGVNVADIA